MSLITCNQFIQAHSSISGLDFIYVVGDIHGDYEALKVCLEKTGMVKETTFGKFTWINSDDKNVLLVFTGDLIDRWRPNASQQDPWITGRSASLGEVADEELIIESAINSLANTVGPRRYVLRLVGNHETTARFSNDPCTNATELSMGIERHYTPEMRKKACVVRHDRFQPERDMGAAIGRCGGYKCIYYADGFIFCHGGLRVEHVLAVEKHGGLPLVETMNSLLSKAWLGERMTASEIALYEVLIKNPKTSILWDRSLSNAPHETAADEANYSAIVGGIFDALRRHYKVHTIVVGHTIQRRGITTHNTLFGRVICVDVGMSRSFAGALDNGNTWVADHAHVALLDVKTRNLSVI
jgi:hypothetical protein